MIKIHKPKKAPNILITNGPNWTTELLLEIDKCGAYSNLPVSVKGVVNERYKHEEIKSLLVPNLHTKCAFCESMPNESGYIEIEHYLPKAIYPQSTYSWENLLPSCKRCNLKKLSLDTGKHPIVKPDVDNPDEYFTFNNIKMIVKEYSPDFDKADRTIKELSLNQHRLIKPRSELLVNLVNFETALEQTLEELTETTNKKIKSRLLNNIIIALDQINELKKPESTYSGFSKDYINKSDIINKAIMLVSEMIE